jgi:hypothetical protein
VGIGVGGVLDVMEEVTGVGVVLCGVDVGSRPWIVHALWMRGNIKTQRSSSLTFLGICIFVDSKFDRKFKGYSFN